MLQVAEARPGRLCGFLLRVVEAVLAVQAAGCVRAVGAVDGVDVSVHGISVRVGAILETCSAHEHVAISANAVAAGVIRVALAARRAVAQILIRRREYGGTAYLASDLHFAVRAV